MLPIDERLQSVVIDAFSLYNKTHSHQMQASGIPLRTSRGGTSMFVDCMDTNQRIAIATGPESPGEFSMGVANKSAPDQIESEVFPLEKLNVATVLAYMEQHFTR